MTKREQATNEVSVPEQLRLIDQINRMSYLELLEKWRFAPSGCPYFVGEVGQHYSRRIAELRAADPAGHVEASKALGW